MKTLSAAATSTMRRLCSPFSVASSSSSSSSSSSFSSSSFLKSHAVAHPRHYAGGAASCFCSSPFHPSCSLHAPPPPPETPSSSSSSSAAAPPLTPTLAQLMDKSYAELLEGNRRWVKETNEKDPNFFKDNAGSQRPEYLWIGCSDSRVPANIVTKTDAGRIFVHRNIANTVVHTDFNLLSVLQYAVDVLEVKHIIVCGHYGCGGVLASMDRKQHGIVDNWIRHIQDTHYQHKEELMAISDMQQRTNRLVELHVINQVYNVGRTTIVQNAWARRSSAGSASVFPRVHGWVYGLHNGFVKDLGVTLSSVADVPELVHN
ncbi:Carbonic anhydrase [Balamuthia mandrillaris]